MSTLPQVPAETENPFSIFPSEGDPESRSGSVRRSGDTENSFAVFLSEGEAALTLPTQLDAVASFQSEPEPTSPLPSEDEVGFGDQTEQWSTETGLVEIAPAHGLWPAVAGVATVCTSALSASRVFVWPLVIAATGMLAVERVSMWRAATVAETAGNKQAVEVLQQRPFHAPVISVPTAAETATSTMVRATEAGSRATGVVGPAAIVAPDKATPAATAPITHGPRPPLSSTDLARSGSPTGVVPVSTTALGNIVAEAPRPVEAPVAEPPAANPVVVPVPAAPLAIAPAMDADAMDRAAIDRVLGTYQRSYSSLDAAAVSTIWRGLDTRGLQRAFNGLDSQKMSFDHCDVHVSTDTAKASCTGVLDYVRKIGQANPLQKRLSWNFDLQRTGDRWLISGVDTR